MHKRANLRTLLGLVMVLWLVMAPLSAVYGQDVVDEDTSGQGAPDGESDGTVDQGADETATGQEAAAGTGAVDASLTNRLYLPAIQGGAVALEGAQVNFNKTWVADACVNVTNSSSNRGLWDDMPGPGGANNEAGLLWFITNDGLNEQCSYRSTIGGLGVLATHMRFRAAVNDTARFYVRLYRLSGGSCLLYRIYATTTTSDDSQFRTSVLFNFPQARICMVRILLSDDPDAFNAAVDTSSVLIDYVQLFNNGVSTWLEGFAN